MGIELYGSWETKFPATDEDYEQAALMAPSVEAVDRWLTGAIEDWAAETNSDGRFPRFRNGWMPISNREREDADVERVWKSWMVYVHETLRWEYQRFCSHGERPPSGLCFIRHYPERGIDDDVGDRLAGKKESYRAQGRQPEDRYQTVLGWDDAVLWVELYDAEEDRVTNYASVVLGDPDWVADEFTSATDVLNQNGDRTDWLAKRLPSWNELN